MTATQADLRALAEDAIEATERLMEAAKAAYTGPSLAEASRMLTEGHRARSDMWIAWRPSTGDLQRLRAGLEPSEEYRTAQARYQQAAEAVERAEAIEAAASEHERRLRGWGEAVEAMREFIKEG